MSDEVAIVDALTVNPEWIGDSGAVAEVMRTLGFHDAIVKALAGAADELAKSGEIPMIAAAATSWFSARGRLFDSEGHPLREALAVVSTFPSRMEHDQVRGIPTAVTSETLLDLQRHMDEFHIRHGVWGFHLAHWLWNHVTGGLYAIEGLQFAPGEWTYPYVVYRTADETLVLADDGLYLDHEGAPRKQRPGTRTSLNEAAGAVRGFPVNRSSGAVGLRETTLPSDARRILGAGDRVLNLHIPTGADVTLGACRIAFRRAVEFFEHFFPHRATGTIICTSWLLDRELSRVLPADSRVVQFGGIFFPFLMPDGDDAQLIERVLDVPAHRETSLRRTIRSHRLAGGRFRMTGGFLLPEDY